MWALACPGIQHLGALQRKAKPGVQLSEYLLLGKNSKGSRRACGRSKLSPVLLLGLGHQRHLEPHSSLSPLICVCVRLSQLPGSPFPFSTSLGPAADNRVELLLPAGPPTSHRPQESPPSLCSLGDARFGEAGCCD